MRIREGLAVAMAVAAIAVLGASAAAQPTVETIAEGLNIPRGITLAADGSLYVVEAGTAGESCMGEGEEQVCMGPTGAITTIAADGTAAQVATGLMSVGLSGGTEIAGASDVVVADDGTLYVTMNLGGDPAERAGFPPDAAVAGWLVAIAPDGTVQPFADVAAFEGTNDPEPTMVDSNPYSVAVIDGGFVVADAGGNDLLKVDESGAVSLVAVFPPFEAQFPAELLAAMGPPPEEENALPVEGSEAAASGEPAMSAAPAEAAESAPVQDSEPAASGAPAAGEMVTAARRMGAHLRRGRS